MIGEAICPAHGLEMNQLRYRTALGRVLILPGVQRGAKRAG